MAHKYSVDAVNQRLLFDFPAVPTEVGVLLGARSASGDVAREAAKLIRNDMFGQVILSGGLKVFQPAVAAVLAVNGLGSAVREHPADFFSRMTEAAYMRHVLVEEEGIPEDRISYVEETSTNTGQNFKNIQDVLVGFCSAGIVTTAYHQRRALGTALHHVHDTAFVSHPVYPFGLTQKNWNRPGIKSFLFGEMAKMDPANPKTYVGKFCKDPDIERERYRAIAYACSSGPG